MSSGARVEEPWAGSPAVGQLGWRGSWEPLLSALLDPRPRQGWGCPGLGGWCFVGKGVEPTLRPLDKWRQWPGKPGGGGLEHTAQGPCFSLRTPQRLGQAGANGGVRRGPVLTGDGPAHTPAMLRSRGTSRGSSTPRRGGGHCPQVFPEPHPLGAPEAPAYPCPSSQSPPDPLRAASSCTLLPT